MEKTEHRAVFDALKKMGFDPKPTAKRPKFLDIPETGLSARTFLSFIQGVESVKRSDKRYLERYIKRASDLLAQYLQHELDLTALPDFLDRNHPVGKALAKKSEKAWAKLASKKRDEDRVKDGQRKTKVTQERQRKERGGNKKVGVIATIHEVMATPEGGTKEEILAVLVERFPERSPLGMKTSVDIEVSQIPRKVKREKLKYEVEGRGMVFRLGDPV